MLTLQLRLHVTDPHEQQKGSVKSLSVVTGDLNVVWLWASVRSRLALTFPAVPVSCSEVCPWWMTCPSHAHNTQSSHSSCPLRAYPYNGIRRPVMETRGTRSRYLLLDTFGSDQSLFGCLGGSWEMSLAAVWEVRVCASVWLGIFRVTCRIHLSNLLGADSYCALAWGVARSH